MPTDAGDFVAWGYVAGGALHPGFRLDEPAGSFELTRDIPDSFLQLEPPGVLEPKLPGGFYVTGVKRQPRVGSQVAFRLSVAAADSDAAFIKTQDELLPRYLAGISAIAEEPLYGAVVAVHRRGEDEQWLPRMSSAELRFIPQPRTLSADELAEVPSLVWAAQHDATGRLAASDFHAANMYLACRTGAVADDQAILSTYYFVLERIAKRLNKDRPLLRDPDGAGQRVRELQLSLEVAGDVDEQVAIIGAANRDIQGMRRRGMRRGIRDAGDTLGVADTQIAQAVKFTDLRNSKLGHPAPLGDHSQELAGCLRPRPARWRTSPLTYVGLTNEGTATRQSELRVRGGPAFGAHTTAMSP